MDYFHFCLPLSTISFFVLFLRFAITRDISDPMDLRQLMASSCRQKILETLSKVEQTHMMDLVRRVNSTYTQVNRNIEILEWEGIIEIKNLGRMKIIQLKREDDKTKAILKALEILGRQEVLGSLYPIQKKS